MPLRTKCPTGHKLIVPDDRAGTSLRCPRCGEMFVVEPDKKPGTEDRRQEAGVRGQESGVRKQGANADGQARHSIALAESGSVAGAVGREERASVPASSLVKPKSRALPPKPATPESNSATGTQPAAESLASPLQRSKAEEPAPVVDSSSAAAAAEQTLAEPLPPPEIESPEPIAAASPLPEAVSTDPQPAASSPRVAVSPAAEPEAIAAPKAIAPDPHWRPAVYSLAAGMVTAALFGMVPAVWEAVEYARYLDVAGSPQVARWALVLFLLGLVQTAYAVYLFQVPDWASVWVVTIYSLALAGAYAMTLGLVLISDIDGFLIGQHGLQLADKLAGGKAALWCLCMVSVSTILAFFAGRLSVQWHRAETLIRRAGL
jgi:hypothetical protein